MFKESVRLKNDKLVNISLLITKDNYIFTAIDAKNNIVAKCVFKILRREVTYLANTKLKKYEGKYLIKDTNQLNKSASSKIVEESYILKNNLSKNSNIYVCQLDLIEITDENYFKTGLGSLIFKKMEEFAKTQNCQEIVGWFYPNGNLWYGAKDFYIKNGFSFEQDIGGKLTLRKSNLLSKEK